MSATTASDTLVPRNARELQAQEEQQTMTQADMEVKKGEGF